jgi:hypothetical protein
VTHAPLSFYFHLDLVDVDCVVLLLLCVCAAVVVTCHDRLLAARRNMTTISRAAAAAPPPSSLFVVCVSLLGFLVLGSTSAFTMPLLLQDSRLHTRNSNSLTSLGAKKTKLLSVKKEENDVVSTCRRRILQNSMVTATTYLVAATNVFVAKSATALDFDAFESSQISSDTSTSNPELSDDEALCKYGAPGLAMGEACKRAKMKPRLPKDVSADGKADRGDYLKCVNEWNIVGDKYVKTRVCKSTREWGPSVK